MVSLFFISIFAILFLTIAFLTRKISQSKKEHKINIIKLRTTLSNATEKGKGNSQKLILSNELNLILLDARKLLSTEIFDLQMNIFRKLTQNETDQL